MPTWCSSTPPGACTPRQTSCASWRRSSTWCASARSCEFNRELELDALIVTKLDGTAKGGIALAVSHELELPIIKIGVGEGLDDLRDFDAHDFARALVGAFDQRQAK